MAVLCTCSSRLSGSFAQKGLPARTSLSSLSSSSLSSLACRFSGSPANAAVPRNAEELFQPLSRSTSLPEWAESYIGLLAESTNSQGAMQSHLMKLLVRGAAGTSKIAQFAQDPLDETLDQIADASSAIFLKHLVKAQASRSVSAGDLSSQEYTVQLANNDGCMEAAGDAKPATRGWKKLRLAVLGSGCFKSSLQDKNKDVRSKDDSDLPEPRINPLHSKCLSLMLSMMLSGSASAMTHEAHVPDLSSIFRTDVMTAAASTEMPAVHNLGSIGRSPSLGGKHAAASGADGLLGSTGMAASTAMKLLRGDSKRTSLPGFAESLGTVLDVLGNSMCDDTEAASTQSRTHCTSRNCPSRPQTL